MWPVILFGVVIGALKLSAVTIYVWDWWHGQTEDVPNWRDDPDADDAA